MCGTGPPNPRPSPRGHPTSYLARIHDGLYDGIPVERAHDNQVDLDQHTDDWI